MAGRLANERFGRQVRRLVPRIVAEAAPSVLSPGERHVLSIDRTGTRMAVARLGRPSGEPTAILLVAQTPEGERLLRRRAAAQLALRADPRLGAWGRLVPPVLQTGSLEGRPFMIEGALPGRPALRRAADLRDGDAVLARAAERIHELHASTSAAEDIDERRLESWVGDPIRRIRRSLDGLGSPSPHRAALAELQARLEHELAGRTLTVSWIHGDYWPGNLLVDDDRSITGIVDWDRATDAGLALHDELHLVVYTSALVRRVEPGRIVLDALELGAWPPELREAYPEADQWWRASPADGQLALLLYWLRFAAATLEQSDFFVRNPRWRRENLDRVIVAAARGRSAA